MDKKRLAVNMAAQLLAFAVNMGISFVLARVIEEQIGQNTYGLVALANQFVLQQSLCQCEPEDRPTDFCTLPKELAEMARNIFPARPQSIHVPSASS